MRSHRNILGMHGVCMICTAMLWSGAMIFMAVIQQHDKSVDPMGPIYGTRRVVVEAVSIRTAQESRSASRAVIRAFI